jgi:hypothetical protein
LAPVLPGLAASLFHVLRVTDAEKLNNFLPWANLIALDSPGKAMLHDCELDTPEVEEVEAGTASVVKFP